MKIISTPSIKLFFIVLLFCNVILLTASCSQNDEPDSGSASNLPVRESLNIIYFNGYFLSNIEGETTTIRTSSDGSTSSSKYSGNILRINYNVVDNKYKKIFDINFAKNFTRSFFGYPDLASFENSSHMISDEKVNFSPQGLLTKISYNSHESDVFNTHYQFIDEVKTFVFKYNKDGYLVECRAEINSDIFSGALGGKEENVKATAIETTSYEWENGNLKTVIYDYQTTDSRKSPYTVKYELTYNDIENNFRQYPYSLIQFLLNDDFIEPCFAVGLMGIGPANTLEYITVTDKNGKKITHNVEITYKDLNRCKVIDKEIFENNSNAKKQEKEYSEYTYEYIDWSSRAK